MAKRDVDRPNPEMPIAPELAAMADRLHRLHLQIRWATAVLLWLIAMPIGLWLLRSQLLLLGDYFTWAGLRYGLRFNLIASVLTLLPIAWTLSLLIWQCRNALFGMAEVDRRRLLHHASQVIQQGDRHPLWRWLQGDR
jgi:hypothetical protein